MRTTTKYYRIDRRQIAFMKFIFEAYDGVANLSTINPETGIVKLNIAPGYESLAEAIVDDLSEDIIIESLSSMEARI